MKLTVVHLEGSKQGQTEYLPGPVIAVGRDPASNQLAFDPYKDLDVSSNHASITFQGEQVMLQDLGSRNGTFLNGARVNGAVPLPNDSVVQFGEKGPKVKLQYIFHAGPGKKTQMIMDLSDKLAGAETAQKKAEEEQKKAKSRNIVVGLCFFFLLIIAVVVMLVVSSINKKKELKAATETLKAELPTVRTKSERFGGATTAEAKAEWDAAIAALTAAEEAEKAEDWALAKTKYDEATKKFRDAGETANLAETERNREALANANKMKDQADADRKRQEEEAKKRIAEERAAMLKALEDHLNAKKIAEQLANSTDPEALGKGKETLEKAVAANPNDPELKAALEQITKNLERAKNIGELLKKAASEAKTKIVALRVNVFAIPGNQRLDTTRIRIPVATGYGSGFFASAAGHIVTAKEVVEPQHFDPKALALATKLKDKGMQVLSEIEVMTSTAGIYTTTYVTPKVAVSRRFNDSIGAEQPVKITFDNAEVEVKVRPHRRDESDIVILKVDGLTDQPFLKVAASEVAAGLPVLALGAAEADKDEDGVLKGQWYLGAYEGKVGTQGRRMEVETSSLGSFKGGPVIDADGTVVGVLIEEGSSKSKALAPTVFKSELE